MANGARKNAKFKALSTAPTFNKTPVGGATPPVPYPVTEDLSSSAGTVKSVQFNGDAAYVLKQSSQPSCKGDAAGTVKGVKSSTTSGEVKPVAGATTVRANKQPVIRDGDPCTLNGGNCPGIYQSQPAGSGNSPDNPIPSKVHPQTEPEQSFWSKASPWVHGALGVASFVPGLSIVTGAADAAIYAAEGDLVEAGLAAASMIPGGKIATTAGKAGKAGLKMLKGADDAAKLAKEAKAAQEAAKAAKLAKEAKAAKEAEEEAAKAAKKGKDNTQVKGQKPHKDCGKQSKYSQAPKGRGAADLEADHTPSGAALEKAMREKLKEMGVIEELSKKEIKSIADSLKREAPTITIPKDVHAEGNTYKTKNNETRITTDSKDLKAAAKRDTDAIQKSMDGKDHGCSEAYKAAAKKLLEETDFDKLIKDSIERGLKRFGK